MNEIKIKVKFKKGLCYSQGIKLVQNDYNSTKLVFEFDDEDGTKIFEMKDDEDNVILADEIVNNELILVSHALVTTKVNNVTYIKYTDGNGTIYWYDEDTEKLYDIEFIEVQNIDIDTLTKVTKDTSLFKKAGNYTFEVSLYKDNSKLTSVADKLKVTEEQVVIDGEIVETYTPMFDNLLSDLSSALQETDNIDIDVEKIGNTSIVTITKKDGQQETVQILDGEKGDTGEKGEKGDTGIIGPQGPQGMQGPIGPQGKAFTISKTYSSISEMNADFNNMEVGDYVMIASSVELEDNAKLYVKGEEEWLFVSDFSGAMGIQGEQGIQGPQGPQGIQGIQGETGNGIATIQKTSTYGLIDTYTITYTDGTMSTFNITNGKDGDVSQEQLDETNLHLDYLSKLSNLFGKITGTGTNITLNNTSDTILKIKLNANDLTQGDSPSPSNPQNIHVIKGNNEVKISNYEADKEYNYPINLGDIEICKIGHYQDVLFKNTLNSEYYDSSLELNKWYKLARIRKLELNISDMNNNEDYPGWRDVPNLRNDFPNTSSGIQTHTTDYKCNIAVSGITLNTLNNNSILYLHKSNFGLTQTQWKTTYPNLVFELYYRITTPTYTLLNDTLQNQLDNLQYALAYDTQTNISQTNTDLPFIIDAETYAK